MHISLITIILLVFAFTVWFFFLGKISRSGNSPGMIDSKLTQCPEKRNCVCSEYPQDPRHFINPILLPENTGVFTLASLKTTLQDMGGVIRKEQENYLAATFSSKIFGFIDDLEIRIVPEERLIHVRSGSRVGDSDLGVNRKRVELLRSKLLNQVKKE